MKSPQKRVKSITEYISKNTVIPFLLDAARDKCRVAFENSKGPTVWDILKDHPDRYIYPAVRHGITWNYRANHPNKGEPLHAHDVGAGLVPAQSEGQPRGLPLPDEIAMGLNPSTLRKPVGEVTSGNDIETIRLRKHWNKPAPAEYGLPTEIWREVVARRTRYDDIKAKLIAGEVRDNDLNTLNLDIRQFALDVIETCEGPDLLR